MFERGFTNEGSVFIAEVDFKIGIKLIENLSARTAGRSAVGYRDGDGGEAFDSFGYSLKDRDALGTDTESVGGIFYITPAEDITICA